MTDAPAKRRQRGVELSEFNSRDVEPLSPNELQLTEIIREMNAGRWRSATSLQAKARKWGVSVSTVKLRAAEAARFVRWAVGDDADAMRAQMVAHIEAIGEAARIGKTEALGKDGPVEVRRPDHKAGLQALELKARLLRLIEAPAKGPPTPVDWATLTPEVRLQRIARGRAYLDQLEAETRASMALPVSATSEEPES